MTLKQRTIKNEIQYKGAGLHSGLAVTMTLKPAPADTGIVFVRTDLPNKPQVKAAIENVTNTMRATTLENGDAKVFTVEHLLSAFYGMQIANCIVELDSAEPPVAGGCGEIFSQLIKDAGIEELDAEYPVYKVKEAHGVYEDDKFITIKPYDGFRVTFISINSHPMLGTQYADYEITPEVYAKEIAPARTIGFTKEIEQLQAMGLAKGGSIENVIVYDDEKCLSELRFDDELVRHKILDVLGDLFMLGPIQGHIVAVKSSHSLNYRLASEILKEIKGGL